MVTLLKNSTTTGVYLLIDVGGWVAANTPGEADLDSLVLGTSYMYFDDFLALAESVVTPRDETILGWKFVPDGSVYLKTKGITGQNIFRTFTLSILADSTEAKNFRKFFDTHQQVSYYQLYLVRQYAAETFDEFSYNATLKKYAQIVLPSYSIVETNKEGRNVRTLNINMVNAWRQNTL